MLAKGDEHQVAENYWVLTYKQERKTKQPI